MNKDRLTARERFGLLLIDEIPDRVVTYPLVTSHAVQITDYTVKEYCTNGKIMGFAQTAAWKHYRHDAISIFSEVGIIAEAMGSKYKIRDNDVPILIEPAIKNEDDFEKIKLPNPYKDGRLHIYIDAIKYCYDSIGDLVPIIAYIPASFTTAAQLRGISTFLKDTIRAPKNAHQLLKISTIAAKNLIDVCMKSGALPMLVDPLASNSVISPRIFNNFALPYLKQLIKFMHKYDLDTMIHICGNTGPIIDSIPDTNVELFSFDKTDCNVVKKKIGSKIRLIGNVSPEEFLYLSPTEVEEKVKQTINSMKNTPKGFVIATGCELPIKTPPENVKAFISTAKKYGRYW